MERLSRYFTKKYGIILTLFLLPFMMGQAIFVPDYLTDLSDTPSSYSGEGGQCIAVKGTEDGVEFVACGSGGGDSVTVNSTSVDTTANFLDGDIDWTLTDGGVGGPDDITATVACTGCIDATDLAANSVDSSELVAGSVDFSHFGTDIITGAEAVGTFTSGDTFLCNEAGVGVRECDYDDLPAGTGMSQFYAEDGDGTEVTIEEDKEWKFVEGTGIDINFTDVDNGTDADPFDLTFTVDATLAEILAGGADANDVDITSIAKLEGVDTNTFIDMDGSDTIEIKGNIIPNTDDADDLGSATNQFKDAYIDGTLEADTITEGGNAVYNSTETPGGELGGTWESPTVDDTGITLTSITIGSLLGVDSIDATGAVDMDYGSGDVTDHTFVSDGGTTIVDGTITSVGNDLGSTDAEWDDLFLNDGGKIQLGDDQDVTITHVADTGVQMELDDSIMFGDTAVFIESDDDGYLDLDADTGIRLNGPTSVGANDFTGTATITLQDAELEVPNGTADKALATAGEMHLNTTDEQVSFHSAADGEISGEASISLLRHLVASFDPGSWYDSDGELFLMKVGDDAPEGITIVEWALSCNVDPDTELALDLKYADAWIGLANAAVIDVLDTTNGVSSEDTNASINSGNAIANGKVIYLSFDSDPEGTCVQATFEMWFYNEED